MYIAVLFQAVVTDLIDSLICLFLNFHWRTKSSGFTILEGKICLLTQTHVFAVNTLCRLQDLAYRFGYIFELQQMTFSNYKHHNTFNGLVDISPDGVITFVSLLYPGTSDKELTTENTCGTSNGSVEILIKWIFFLCIWEKKW